jgi:two-component system, OmpR family, KDP operon response regulator KdpE
MPEYNPHCLPSNPQRITHVAGSRFGEDAAIHTGVSMNWKVNTIANHDNGKRTPEGELPIRMTLVKGTLDRTKSETEGVDISRAEGEIASGFLVAIQTAQDSDDLQGRPWEAVGPDYSVNLLPLHELIARVCVALKRNVSSKEEVLFSVGYLHLDASRHLVQKRGRPLHSTPKEFALLHNLMMNAGKPVPHRKPLRSVWGSQYGCEREYLRIFVRQLRVKIEDNPANPKYLLTEPSIGYRFAESVEGDCVIPSSE